MKAVLGDFTPSFSEIDAIKMSERWLLLFYTFHHILQDKQAKEL